MPAPQPAQPPAASQDPSVSDLIRQEATRQGVPPELALAVGEQESGFNPTVTGPRLGSGEQGIGTFQLLPSTAKRLGVDPTHPTENIRGGVRYLRELLDQHQGNLEQVLKAYGGVKTDTSYVPSVLGRIPKFSQPQGVGVGTPPPSPATPPSDPATFVGPEQPESWTDWAVRHGKDALSAIDPRTPSGRRNIMGGLGAAGATAAVVGTAPVSAPIAGIGAATAGILGAVGGGMAAEAGEQLAGTAPPSGRNALLAGGEQGLYEAAGHTLLWPIKTVGRRMVASRVGRYAAEGLSSAKEATLGRLQSALDSAQSLLRVTKADTQEANALATTGTRQAVSQAAGQAKAGVARAGQAGEAGVAAAQAPYDQLVGGPPPSAAKAGRQASHTIQEGGPARARNLAGQAVETAAESGPDVDLTGLKAEAQRILEQEIRPPAEAFPRVAAEEGTVPMGIGEGAYPKEAIARTIAGGGPSAQALQEAMASAQSEGSKDVLKHPAMGVINRILNAADTVSFADAHKFKRELDEAIGTAWDRTVKSRVTNVTKRLRGDLREALSGHAPYDRATAAYAKIAPLYTQGIAPKLRKLATEEPEAIVRLINPKQPTRAKMLVDLLTTQAAAGGDAEGGQRALEAVQAAWVHQKLIQGGIEKLGARIDALPPEFASSFLGDAKAQQVLSNLKQIHTTYQSALAAGQAGVESARAAGQAGVQTARATGEGVRAATRATGRQAVETAAQGVPPARQALREGRQAAQGEMRDLATSSLGPTLKRGGLEHAAADVLRAAALGPSSVWGGLSIVRLLHGPTANDLLRWAAYSPAGTSALVKAITSPAPDLALADLVRSSGILGEATNRVTGKPSDKPPVQPKGATPPVGSPPPSP